MSRPTHPLVCFALVALLVCGCRPPAETALTNQPISPIRFDGDQAYGLVRAQTEFGYRPSGSEAGWATGEWIISQLVSAGWSTQVQEFEYHGVICRNIIGTMPLEDSQSQERPIVLLGAHYDTRMKADMDSVNPDQPVLGANDGASGTAVLLELAQVLEPAKIPWQVKLVFFDAEDNGRLDGWDWIVGSTYFASRLETFPAMVIIVDMIGDADQQIYYERNSDASLQQTIWQQAGELGYGDYFIPEYRHAMLDDHTPFSRLGIPAVDIIDFDYPYWHTANDTLDKVSEESLERVGRTVETWLESVSIPGMSDG